eukprot:2936256-Rhodomonas_salina.4
MIWMLEQRAPGGQCRAHEAARMPTETIRVIIVVSTTAALGASGRARGTGEGAQGGVVTQTPLHFVVCGFS